MTLKEFVAKYVGKKVDFDKAFGSQCVDLFRQYNSEVFGFPHTGAVEGAADLFTKHSSLPVQQKYYDLVITPEEGDVVVFGPSVTNKYGHVAIVLWSCKTTLIVFEQDGFKQELGAKIATWGYERVLGYLRKK